ncbi:MAG: SHOCT domain-containing protein, partial [Okeania sp. SIO2H7]|nr:SHOCT domain-containing protein [Okeania sp. SIO2H7]
AFFEFIGLLLMSDTAFDAKYNPGVLSGTAGATRSAKDVTGALGELHQLYESGALTAEEYEQKRRKLLKDL